MFGLTNEKTVVWYYVGGDKVMFLQWGGGEIELDWCLRDLLMMYLLTKKKYVIIFKTT